MFDMRELEDKTLDELNWRIEKNWENVNRIYEETKDRSEKVLICVFRFGDLENEMIDET